MMKVLVVDDEPYARAYIKHTLQKSPYVRTIVEAAKLKEAQQLLATNQFDLVCLDIEVGSDIGFALLEPLDAVDFDVIFISAFSKYAVQAFRYSGLDYILKPFEEDQLLNAVKTAAQRRKDNQTRQKQMELFFDLLRNTENKKICLSTIDGMEFVPVADIYYCAAQGAYTEFFLKGQRKILVSKNLKEYEQLLDNQVFMRVQNSYVINLREVKKYVKQDGGFVIMNNGKEISVSNKKKDDFILRMTRIN